MDYHDEIKNHNSKLLFIIFFCLLFGYILLKNIQSSVFLMAKDRVNVVFYGQNTTFYSLGKNDVSYFFTLSPNVEMLVPGSYGYYRLGALGKLISLEKKPDLLKKVFSGATSSFVDLYFFPSKPTIYYGETEEGKSPFSLIDIFMNNSNGNVIDRLFLWLNLVQRQEGQDKKINNIPIKKEGQRLIYDYEKFHKDYQGFFYKKTHRNLKDNVQIIYTKSYKTADLLSMIIEGEGIRVVDLTEKKMENNQCLIIENQEKNISQSAKDLSLFFNCSLKKGPTEVSDIILILGDLERKWTIE